MQLKRWTLSVPPLFFIEATRANADVHGRAEFGPGAMSTDGRKMSSHVHAPFAGLLKWHTMSTLPLTELIRSPDTRPRVGWEFVSSGVVS